MPMRLNKLPFVAALAVLCLVSGAIPLSSLHAQPSAPEHERAVNREIQHERNAEEWRRHNERFFGPGIVIERYPGEAYDAYVLRIQARCDAQYNTCAASCNLVIDPVLRTSCTASCNNDYYECKAGY